MALMRLQLVDSHRDERESFHEQVEVVGLAIVRSDVGSDVIEVEGDPVAVLDLIAGWDGQGRIELLEP